MGRRWTQHDVENLRRMAQQYPASVIAEKIDRPVTGVISKAHQLKLSLRTRRRGEYPGDPGPAGFDWRPRR
jgi:hypothetical protein